LETPEITWGTHEKTLPNNAEMIGRNFIALKSHAYKEHAKSYAPDANYVGMLIPHGETTSLSKVLSCESYSPTIQFVY